MISNRRFQTHRFFILFSVLVLTCLALFGSFNAASAKPQFSAIAVDARTGKILFSKDIDGQRHPASLTKVMTLYVVFQDLQAGRLKLSSELKISNRAASMQPTKLGLKPGETIKVEDAIKVLVTRSANDISAAIGENLEGSESNFAARMTRTARSIGMSKSTFKNASGLPNPAQVTTARDMATLSLRIQRDFPEYYHYFRISSFNYGKQTIRTHNRLLGKFEGTDGIKTGYIRASGFNLTTSARRGKKRIVGVVMGGSSGSSRDKYMMSMLEKAFPNCVDGEMIAAAVGTSKGAIVPETKIAAVVPKEKPATDKKGLAKKIEAASVADGPVAEGETNFEKLMAGSDDVSAPDTKVLEAKIEETTVASTEGPVVDPAPLPAKLPFEVKKAVPIPTEKAAPVPTEKKVVANVESSWNIQIGAYPKKEEARLKLKEIRASGYKFLSGKQAITVEVQKGSKTVYRARFSGFTQKTAKAACAQLSKKGLTCLAYSPQS